MRNQILPLLLVAASITANAQQKKRVYIPEP